jgi:hypothetical protein
MQGIFPTIRDFGMDCAHSAFLARALRDGELRLEAAIELRGRQFLPLTRGDQILQPQVNAYVSPR